MSIEPGHEIEFSAKGLISKKRETTAGKTRFGGFVGVVVSIEAGRVYVTENGPRGGAFARCDLGPAYNVIITAQSKMHLVLVTLAGNGNACAIRMNTAAVAGLQGSLTAKQTERRTSRDAAAVAEAIERFAELLARGQITEKEFATVKAKLIGAA